MGLAVDDNLSQAKTGVHGLPSVGDYIYIIVKDPHGSSVTHGTHGIWLGPSTITCPGHQILGAVLIDIGVRAILREFLIDWRLISRAAG